MHKHRLERVLVINDNFELRGLITVKDILKSSEHPHASKDEPAGCAWARRSAWARGPKERVEACSKRRRRDRRRHGSWPFAGRADRGALDQAASTRKRR
jgi:hypothetical protein